MEATTTVTYSRFCRVMVAEPSDNLPNNIFPSHGNSSPCSVLMPWGSGNTAFFALRGVVEVECNTEGSSMKSR